MSTTLLSTTLGVPLSSLTTLQTKGSINPLFRFQSTDKLTTLSLQQITVNNVQFVEDPTNTDASMFFYLPATGENY